MKDLEYLVGDDKIHRQVSEPYNNEVINFLSDISDELDNEKYYKSYSDIKTLSFFCRKANLLNLKKRSNNIDNKPRLGLGLVFHITPSNIPTNFFYSLIFGLINGNSNIVKVPSKNFEQISIICKVLKKLLSKKHKKIKNFVKIVRYNDNDEYTKKISSFCDARIIWGSDKTVENVRKFALQPRSIELTFPDRYSMSLINANEFSKLNFEKKQLLVHRFYNDTFVADQNACSSPQLILWVGNKIKKSKSIFWSLLSNLVEKKYDLSEMAAVEKYTELCKKIITDKNIKGFKNYSNNVFTTSLKKIDSEISSYRGKWGFFYEYETKNLNILNTITSKKIQTLTYFGIAKDHLRKFIIKNKLSGIDRIVPIGQGLEINFFWDGYDINKILTRVIDIK